MHIMHNLILAKSMLFLTLNKYYSAVLRINSKIVLKDVKLNYSC